MCKGGNKTWVCMESGRRKQAETVVRLPLLRPSGPDSEQQTAVSVSQSGSIQSEGAPHTFLHKAHQVIDSLPGAAAANMHTVKRATQLVGPVLREDVAAQEHCRKRGQASRLLDLVQLACCILHCSLFQLHHNIQAS